jgi:hypothetical protein
MLKRVSHADDFAQLVEKAEWLAHEVEDLRSRIAARAQRRASSGNHSVADIPSSNERTGSSGTREQAPRVPSSFERPSCLAEVSRWLPPVEPANPVHRAMGSGLRAKVQDAGRYSIIRPRLTQGQYADESEEADATDVSTSVRTRTASR